MSMVLIKTITSKSFLKNNNRENEAILNTLSYQYQTTKAKMHEDLV